MSSALHPPTVSLGSSPSSAFPLESTRESSTLRSLEIPCLHPSLHRPPTTARYAVDESRLRLVPSIVDDDNNYEHFQADEDNINDGNDNKKVRRQQHTSTKSNASDSHLKGCASAEMIPIPLLNLPAAAARASSSSPESDTEHNCQPTPLVRVPVLTSALPHRTSVLSICIGCVDGPANAAAEVDLSGCVRFLHSKVVRIRSFVETTTTPLSRPYPRSPRIDDEGGFTEEEDDNYVDDVPVDDDIFGRKKHVLRLNLIDEGCTVLTLRFSLDFPKGEVLRNVDEDLSNFGISLTPHPTNAVDVYPIREWLKVVKTQATTTPNPGSRLSSRELVDFTSSTTVILALTPLLLHVDLTSNESGSIEAAVAPWVSSAAVYRPAGSDISGEGGWYGSGVLSVAGRAARKMTFGMFAAGDEEESDDMLEEYEYAVEDDDWDNDTGNGEGRRRESAEGAVEEWDDAPTSTAALCVVRHGGTGESVDRVDGGRSSSSAGTITIVFTLHADGMLRKWTLPPSSNHHGDSRTSLYPLAVHRLRIVDTMNTGFSGNGQNNDLACGRENVVEGDQGRRRSIWARRNRYLYSPDVTLWHPSDDAIVLSGRILDDGKSYVLATSIQTSLPVVLEHNKITGTNSSSAGAPASCFVSVMRGDANFHRAGDGDYYYFQYKRKTKNGKAAHAQRTREVVYGSYLVVPEEAEGTVDMSFGGSSVDDDEGGGLQLHCLYYSTHRVGYDSVGGNARGYAAPTVRRRLHEHRSLPRRAIIATYSLRRSTGYPRASRDGCSSDPPHTSFKIKNSVLVTSGPHVAHECTLESVASAERSSSDVLRLSATHLHGSDETLGSVSAAAMTLEEVDGLYMRYLFRQVLARPNGGGTGAGACSRGLSLFVIHRALRKVYPNYKRQPSTLTSTASTRAKGMSIEASVLGAMREWARQDEAKATTTAPTSTMTATSTTTTATTIIEEDETLRSSESLQKHQWRWQSFLKALWEEEALLRRPLLISSSPPTERRRTRCNVVANVASLVVRTGVTCAVLNTSEIRKDESHGDTATLSLSSTAILDRASMSLLMSCYPCSVFDVIQDEIGYDVDLYRALRDLERETLSIVSDGTLAACATNETKGGGKSHAKDGLEAKLCYVGLRALERRFGGGMTDQVQDGEIHEILSLLHIMDAGEMVAWAESCPLLLPPLSSTYMDTHNNSGTTMESMPSKVGEMLSLPAELLDSSVYLSRLYMENARRLSLGRCLLLFGLTSAVNGDDECAERGVEVESEVHPSETVAEEEARFAAVRTFLTISAVQWVSSQPGCCSSVSGSVSVLGRKVFQSRKVNSVARMTTTVLDEFVGRVSKMSRCASIEGKNIDLLDLFVQRAMTLSRGFFKFFVASSSSRSCSSPSSLFLDFVDLLPPRLGLRVLAPSLAYPRTDNGMATTRAMVGWLRRGTPFSSWPVSYAFRIKVTAARCMLKEAAFGVKHGIISCSEAKALRSEAAALYREAVDDAPIARAVSIDNGVDFSRRAAATATAAIVYDVLACGREDWQVSGGSVAGCLDEKIYGLVSELLVASLVERVIEDARGGDDSGHDAVDTVDGVGIDRSSSTRVAEVARTTAVEILSRLPSTVALFITWIVHNDFDLSSFQVAAPEAADFSMKSGLLQSMHERRRQEEENVLMAMVEQLLRQIAEGLERDSNSSRSRRSSQDQDGNDRAQTQRSVSAASTRAALATFLRALERSAHMISLLDTVGRGTGDDSLAFVCAVYAIESLQSSPSSCLLSSLSSPRSTLSSRSERGILPDDMVERMTEVAALHSAAFRHACRARKWDGAFASCRANPVASRKRDDFRRLVVCMTESGVLDKLLSLPHRVIVASSSSSLSTADDTMDLYEEAAAALEEKAQEEQRRQVAFLGSSAGSGSSAKGGGGSGGSKCFFTGCLYALYASKEEWRLAAQSMDDWYRSSMLVTTTVSSLRSTTETNQVGDGDKDHGEDQWLATHWNLQADEAVSMAALACAMCIRLVENKRLRFLFSGENVICRTNSSGSAHEVDDDGGGGGTYANRLDRLKLQQDIVSRAILAMSFVILRLEEAALTRRTSGSVEGPSSFSNKKSKVLASTEEVIDRLASLGYYHHAITLAKTSFFNKNSGRRTTPDFFAKTLLNILCNHVTPVTVSLSRSPSSGRKHDDRKRLVMKPDRPTPNQLAFLADSFETNTAGTYPNGKLATNVLSSYLQRYAHGNDDIVIKVASTYLDIDSGRSVLPQWMTNLILKGNIDGKNDAPTAGLFANSFAGRKSSAANPVALLKLYMDRGMYVEACNLITTVLMGHDDGEKRKLVASQRLPEKGQIHFVPYARIDMLWKIIDKVVSEGKMSNRSQKIEVLRARRGMEEALRFHFEMLAAGEMGLPSARALSSSSSSS